MTNPKYIDDWIKGLQAQSDNFRAYQKAHQMRRERNLETDEVELFLHHETEKAVLVSEFGTEEMALWMPKSMIEINCRRKVGQIQIVSIEAPCWLLEEKGFI